MARFSVLSILLFVLSSVSINAAAVTDTIVYPTSVLADCPAIHGSSYVTPNGVYLISCSLKYFGSDLLGTRKKTATFQLCLDKCATNSQCKSVSWSSKTKTCWLKGGIPNGKKSSTSWSAKWISNAPAILSTTHQSSVDSTTTQPALVLSTSMSTDIPSTFPISSTSTTFPISSISSTSPISTTSTTVSLTSIVPTSLAPVVSTTSQSADVPSVTTQATSIIPSSSVSGGVESAFGATETVAAPPPVILGPVSAPDIDPASLSILIPDPESNLFYKSPSAVPGGTVAKLTVQFKYPSVVLDHSSHVTTQCQNGIVNVIFDSPEAYQQAKDAWISPPFILVTAQSSCSTDGQNVFFLTNSVTWTTANKQATASGSFSELVDLFSDLGLDFGAIPTKTPPSGTPSNNTASTCGTPDSDTINGLPAVGCGSNFDQTLNDKLSYYSGADADFDNTMALLSPGASSAGIQRRGFFSSLKKAVAFVAPYVAPVVKKAVAAVLPYVPPFVQKAVVAVATVAVKIATVVVKVVESILSGDFSSSLNIPIKIGPSSAMLIDSPWGKQFKFYEYKIGQGDSKYSITKAALAKVGNTLIGEPSPAPGIELFCVDCGINGALKATGAVSISATQGFYKGSISLEGNMQAGLFLGVNAFAQWEKTMEKEIIKLGLPGFSIPKVVTIGPSLTLGVTAGLTVEAVGQLLVGTSYSWPAISATMDLMDKTKSSRSGFSPIVTKKFEVYGDVTATATLGLPVTLAFGVDFFGGKWSKEAGLKNVPSMNAVAQFSITAGTPGNSITTGTCKGIAWNVNLANELDLELGDTEYKLWEWVGPVLAQGCIGRTVPEDTASSSSSESTVFSPSTLVSSARASMTSTTIVSSSFASSTGIVVSSTSKLSSSTSPTSYSASSTNYFSSTVLLVSSKSVVSPGSSYTSWAASTQYASSTVLLVTPTYKSSTSLSTSSAGLSSLTVYASSTVLMVTPISGLASYTPQSLTTTTNSFTTTISSAIPSATSLLGPNYPINCPSDNGRNFTDSLGYTYQIKCGIDLPGDDMENAQLGSFQECIDSCFSRQNHDCVAVSWVPGRAYANCNYKGDRQILPAERPDIASVGFEVDSAVLISAPACSTLSCPANTSQYCMSNHELFKISCEIAYQTDSLGSFNLPTLAECIDRCSSQWPGVCNGVVFFAAQYRMSASKSFPTSNCYPFAVGENPVSYALAAGGTSALTRSARNAGQGLWKRTFEVDIPARIGKRSLSSGRSVIDDIPSAIAHRSINPSASRYTSAPGRSAIDDMSTIILRRSIDSSADRYALPPGRSAIDDMPAAIARRSIDSSASRYTSPPGRTSLDDMPAMALKRQSADITGDFSYTSIVDTTSTISLNAATNGNLFITLINDTTHATGTTFGISNGAVMGDSLDRLLHYFPTEVTATGASRLRLAAWGNIPKTAELIMLVPFGTAPNAMLVAVDSRGDFFWMFVCSVASQMNKVFLVKDNGNGVGTLQDPSLKFVVTGGIVDDCAPLAVNIV